MGKIDDEFEKDIIKEEREREEQTKIGKLRKIEGERTEIKMREIAEIREVKYKFVDKVTRITKEISRKIYIFKNEFVSGVPLIVPISVHRDIRDLRLKHGEKMVGAVIKSKGEGINRRYQVVPEVLG